MNDPGIGMLDAALGAEAAGLMTFRDKGNMTRTEIDGLTKLLIDRKRSKHLVHYWTTIDQSVSLLASREVVIQSMFAAGAYFLRLRGDPVRYAQPPEGSRGYAGGLSFSAAAAEDPARLDACYELANWWLSGEPGASLVRLGYYSAVPATARPRCSEAEWAYWIEGSPAPTSFTSPLGPVTQGSVRDGGSMRQRTCRYAAWLSHFDESEHQIERWNALLDA
jgi:putative spermidine/putrescine transport system substrate-binding protein